MPNEPCHLDRLNKELSELFQREMRAATSVDDLRSRTAAISLAFTVQAGMTIGTMVHSGMASEAEGKMCAEQLRQTLEEAMARRMRGGITMLHDLLRRTNATGRTDRHQG